MYVFSKSFRYEQTVTQGQFLSRVLWVSIQSFPSRSVAIQKLKRPVYSNTPPIAGGRIVLIEE